MFYRQKLSKPKYRNGWCSEHFMWSLVTGGMKGLERFNDCHKVTPQDCWLLPHKVLSKAIVF